MTRISRFSPNWSDPDDLEAITVGREDLFVQAVEAIADSALTENKHHLLFIGPRGCGKTHLITLINYRLNKKPAVLERLRIAWLNEAETSDSLLSLLLRAHRALAKEYPAEFPASSTESIMDLSNKAEATEAISQLLLKQLGMKTLLLLMENLDGLFREFAPGEQKRWRALIQNHPQFCTVATAQRLFGEVSDRDAPFFGFFEVKHLKPFTVSQAADLFCNIAKLEKKNALAAFTASPRGRARLRALHHLTGGNQRLFIILAEFIDRDSLDSLVGPFEKLVDEQLTPYYQERLRWLPTLQRRIVEYLCAVPSPSSVKAIARHLISTSQSISSQLHDLRSKGYVLSKKRGRESLYELAEPLMRLSYQVKETKGGAPLRLLVDFLRIWYDREDLRARMQSAGANEARLNKAYLSEAIIRSRKEGSLRLQYLVEDAAEIDVLSCNPEDLKLLRDVMEESGDANDILSHGVALWAHARHSEALEEFTSALESGDLDPLTTSLTLLCRGLARGELGDPKAEIADYSSVIEMPDAPPPQVAIALVNRGVVHGKLGDLEAAIADFSSAVDLAGAPPTEVAKARFNRGVAHGKLGNSAAEIAEYTSVIEMKHASPAEIANAGLNRGLTYGKLGNSEGEIADYTSVIEMPDAPAEQVARALVCRGATHVKLREFASAIADYSTVIEMRDVPRRPVHLSLANDSVTDDQRGVVREKPAVYRAIRRRNGEQNEVRSCAHFGLAEALMLRGDWTGAYRQVEVGFATMRSSSSAYLGDVAAYIDTILNSGQSVDAWATKVDPLLSLYAEHGCLTNLGRGLVVSAAALGKTALSPKGLAAWHTLWAERANIYPELELPARLLGTAIEYFVHGKEESALLDLPSEERRVLRQALGLEKFASESIVSADTLPAEEISFD